MVNNLKCFRVGIVIKWGEIREFLGMWERWVNENW